MNKRQIIASLNKIANELDINSLYQEANILTNIMQRIAKKHDDDDSKILKRMFLWLKSESKFFLNHFRFVRFFIWGA